MSYYPPPPEKPPRSGAPSYQGRPASQDSSAPPPSYYSERPSDGEFYGDEKAARPREERSLGGPSGGYAAPAGPPPRPAAGPSFSSSLGAARPLQPSRSGGGGLIGGIAGLLSGGGGGGGQSGAPAAFMRSVQAPCPPFAVMSLQGRGRRMQSGFPLAPPPYQGAPHPFATHDVTQEDWVTFLQAVHQETQTNMAMRALPLLMGPAGLIVGGITKRRQQFDVGRVVDTWNLNFFEPRRMLVVLTQGLARESGLSRPPPPAFEEEVRRLFAGLPPLQPVGTLRGAEANYYADEDPSDGDESDDEPGYFGGGDGKHAPAYGQQQGYGQQQVAVGGGPQQAYYGGGGGPRASVGSPGLLGALGDHVSARYARKQEKRAVKSARRDGRRMRRRSSDPTLGGRGGGRGVGRDKTWRLFVVPLN